MTARALDVVYAVTASAGPRRRLTAPVVPYGVPAHAAVGGRVLFTGPPDNLDALPDLVEDHDDDAVIGRADALTDEGTALTGVFQVFRHEAGDRVLADAQAGRRTGISVSAAVHDYGTDPDGTVIARAWTIRHVSIVPEPAFGTHIRHIAAAAANSREETDSMTTAPELQATAPAAAPPVDVAASAPVPTAPELQATAPAAVPAAPAARTAPRVDASRFLPDLFARNAREGGSPLNIMAALADITPGGNGAGNGTAALPTQYLGELWSGNPYSRLVVPTVSTRPLTSLTYGGWAWSPAPAVADYAGDKGAVPSNAAKMDYIEKTAKRLAGAHDLDRVYRDLGSPEFWQSYFDAMTTSYKRQTDAYLVDQIESGATVIGTAADSLSAALLTGALAVYAAGGTPTHALVASDVALAASQTKAVDAPVGFDAFGIATPALVLHPSVNAGTVIVYDRNAVTFLEMDPPVRVEAVNIPNGGIDAGVFGYCGVNVNAATAIQKLTVTAPTP